MRGGASWLVWVVALSGCALQKADKSEPDGGTAPGQPTSPSSSPSPIQSPTDVTGARGCAEDAVTKTKLCTSIDMCPGVSVDHGQLPNCGFRPRGWRFDLACWCDGYVCPMGAPSTCADANSLVRSVSEVQVCAQVKEGLCAQGGAVENGNTPPGCNPDCMRECGQISECSQLCGC